MNIKSIMVSLAKKLTGRECVTCRHNRGGRCCHPNGKMFMRCWNSITRPGYIDRSRETARSAQAKLAKATAWVIIAGIALVIAMIAYAMVAGIPVGG